MESDACVVRARYAPPRLRARDLAHPRCQGTGHLRGPRPDRDEVLPVAQRAHRQRRGTEVRPCARQAAPRAASPPPAHTFAAPGYQVAVPLPRARTADGQSGLAALAADPARALIA